MVIRDAWVDSFELPTQYRELRDRARDLAEALGPIAIRADRATSLDDDVAAAVRSSGLLDHCAPADPALPVDPLAAAVIREGLAGYCMHADGLFTMQGIGSLALRRFGSADQHAEWLPRINTLDAIAAFAVTEPDAGSDVKAITTTLTVDGDEIVLNGRKSFISNAGTAHVYSVLAADEDGLSLVLVPADAPGLRVEPGPDLFAAHIIGDVVLENVRLPLTAILAERGGGMKAALATLAVFRVSVAGAAIGIAQRALDDTIAHASTRVQFGRPIARLGAVASMLADSWADLESARLLSYRAGMRARADAEAALPESSMAKVVATEAAGRVVDRAIQVHGRWGLVADSTLDRLNRAVRPMRIYEGASEVLRLGMARELVRLAVEGGDR